MTDGVLLATINLPAYLTSDPADGEVTPSSFCRVQVSADLSTAVAVTQSHMAVAVDLNHYFRYRVLVLLPGFCFPLVSLYGLMSSLHGCWFILFSLQYFKAPQRMWDLSLSLRLETVAGDLQLASSIPVLLWGSSSWLNWRNMNRINRTSLSSVVYLSYRTYPDHLLCSVPQSRPPLQPKHSQDQDSVSSSSCSLVALGSPFSYDR